MSIFRFFFSKSFWISIVMMIIIALTGIVVVYYWLKSYTKQGELIEIPDLSTFTIDEVEREFEKLGLRYEIIDSTEFVASFPRLSVIDQYPSAGSKVKPNRKISLTINASGPRKVSVPDIVDKTRRRAIYDLESKGFEVGELIYVPHIGKDVVLGLRYRGQDVVFPSEFTLGTRFDVIVGMGLSDERVRIPYIKNMLLDDARIRLNSFGLNIGAILYDEDLLDTAKAFIYRQEPAPNWNAIMRMGGSVDVWMTNNENKKAIDSLLFHNSNPMIQDSLNGNFQNEGLEND